MSNNASIVLTPAAQQEQAKRGSARHYVRKIEGGYPDMLFDGVNASSQFYGKYLPEPGSVALLGLGLGLLGGMLRRTRAAGR